jgi:hypothetical protein
MQEELDARRRQLLNVIETAANPFSRESAIRSLEAHDANAARIGRAPSMPVIGTVLASRDGRLLVERLDVRAAGSNDGVAWDLLDPSGNLEGRLVMPANASPRAFEWPVLVGTTIEPGAGRQVIRWEVARIR